MVRLIEKSCGNLTLSVAPELGGAIATLNWQGNPILRPFVTGAERRANQCGSYPLIPWSNRIAESQFLFNGQRYQVKKNFGDSPHAIHGSGWLAAWQVKEESPFNLTLELEQDASEAWPWAWRGTQKFELTEDRLRVTLEYLNLANEQVPAGLGFHPFFANAGESEISFSAKSVWLNAADSLPQKEVEVPERWNYRTYRKPEFNSVDNCFTGWSGCARVRWPERGIVAELTSTASNAVLFIPGKERNVVAIEPVSHVNNAINLLPPGSSSQAMARVLPGESFSVSMDIKVSNDE